MDPLNRLWHDRSVVRLVLVTLGYAVLGTIVTGGVALVSLNVSLPLQTTIYDIFYLRVGPGEATVIAILGQFLFASLVGVIVSMVIAEWLDETGQHWRGIRIGAMCLLALPVVFGGLVFLGLPAELSVLGVLTVGFLGLLLLLRFRYGVRTGSVPAVLGAIPVVILFLLLAGFGIGWGWGYVMIAEGVPESQVSGPVADFDAVPTVRADLLGSGDCAGVDSGQRCRIQLREYPHAVAAVRFMDRHGIRCPAQRSGGGTSDAFYAEHDGAYYRVSCTPHGD